MSETTFHVLQKVTLLPKGLPDAHAVSYKRLLVVGLKQGQTWQTCYYDRRNLPTEVQQIVTQIEQPDL